MKFLVVFTLLLTTICGAAQENKKQEEVCYNPNLVKDTSKKSIKSMAVGLVGKDTVKISYHSPGVRKRIIWGGLVPFDDVWVTGAHNATNITLSKPFFINGEEMPAGKYAFFTIPGQENWTVILNKHWDQHLTNEYDEKDDLIRFTVKPQETPYTERLQYYIVPVNDQHTTIAVAWEKLRIEFLVTAN